MRINSIGTSFGKIYSSGDNSVSKMIKNSGYMQQELADRVRELESSNDTNLWIENNGDMSYSLRGSENKVKIVFPKSRQIDKFAWSVYYVTNMARAIKK